MIRLSRCLLALAACMLASGCATSPTGRNQLIMVSDAQMDRMGSQMFMQFKQKKPTSQDPTTNAHVECVVDHLLAELPRNQRNGWEVRVFRDNTPNAFALPGRKIGVHTGILQLTQNDAQLATVVAHEIGHVLARHSNERASMGMLAEMTQQVAGQINPAGAAVLGVGTQVGVLLPYSRTHETEADVMGQDLMARAGYDPRESIRLWQIMARQKNGAPVEILSTHPADSSRIQKLQAHLRQSMPLYEQALASGRRPACSRY